MNRFPHLDGANGFPGVQNVRPFEQYVNTFDYKRWNPNVRMTLYNVPWDAGGRNVVLFGSESERDAWFESQQSKSVKLTNGMERIDPDGNLKLPLPFDEMCRYNYLAVDFGYATSEGDRVDYETEDAVTKHYYFIQEARSVAPTVSSVMLLEDYWTTFIYDAQVPMLMLERGHYPVANSDVSDYLANPMDNCSYLTAPDVDYGRDTRVRSQTVVPMDGGERYVCFVVPYYITALQHAVKPVANDGGRAPTFTDAAGRNGHLATENVSYGFYPLDFSTVGTVPTDVTTASNGTLMPTNTTTLAVRASDVYDNNYFFQKFQDQYPHLFREIKSCYIVGRDLLSFGASIDFCGSTVLVCRAADDLHTPVKLDKSMFAFPGDIANLAKLYTAPYSRLEFTREDGSRMEFNVENCSNLEIVREVCLAYPWLNVTSFITGSGGAGASSITVHTVVGNTQPSDIWKDDFARFMHKWEIPTLEINFNGFAADGVDKSLSMGNREINQKVNYTNGVSDSNNSYLNTVASNATAKANADRSADTSVTNQAAAGATQNANAVRSTDAAATINSTNNANIRTAANLSNSASAQMVASQNALNTNMTEQDKDASRLLTDAENKATALTNAVNNHATMATAGVQTASGVAGGAASVAGSLATGNIVGAVTSAFTSAASVASTQATAQINCEANTSTSLISQSFNEVASSITRTISTNKNFHANSQSNDALAIKQNLATSNATNNINTATANTNTNNACTLNNTAATVTTSNENTARSAGTSKTNAAATRTTGDSNALDSRDRSIANSQRSADADWRTARNDSRAGRIAQSRTLGGFGGDGTPTADARNVATLSVRTQDDGAIRQTGAQFARYGYNWNGTVDLSNINDFNCMDDFSYWKATEVWVTGDKLIEEARDGIETMLLNGVTVWSDPASIGSVSPYRQIG